MDWLQPAGSQTEQLRAPWQLSLAFAELSLYAALNDVQSPRDADPEVMYYERIDHPHISGMHNVYLAQGIVSLDDTPADNRQFIRDLVERTDVHDILRYIRSNKDKDARKVLESEFLAECVKLIFSNWVLFEKVYILLHGSSIEKSNLIITSDERKRLTDIFKIYAPPYLARVSREPLRTFREKTLYALDTINDRDTSKLTNDPKNIENLKQALSISKLKQFAIPSIAASALRALTWLFFMRGDVDEKRHGKFKTYIDLITICGETFGDKTKAGAKAAAAAFDEASRATNITLRTLYNIPEGETLGNEDRRRSNENFLIDVSVWLVEGRGNEKSVSNESEKLVRILKAYGFVGRGNSEILGAFKKFLGYLKQRLIDVYDWPIRETNSKKYENLIREITTEQHAALINNVFDNVMPLPTDSHMMRSFRATIAATLDVVSLFAETLETNGITLAADIVDRNMRRTELLLETLPAIAQQTFAPNKIRILPIRETGVFPFVMSTLVEVNHNSIFASLHDVMPMARGSIASLLSQLDADPYHQWVEQRRSDNSYIRVWGPYSVVLFINFKYREHNAVYSPAADTGSTYALTIHAKRLELDSRLEGRLERDYIILDGKTVRQMQVTHPFAADHYIFSTLLPLLESDTDPHSMIHLPVAKFAVYRLDPDKANQDPIIKNLKTSIGPSIPLIKGRHDQIKLVSQGDIVGHALACTSYSTIVAFFLFNKQATLDSLLDSAGTNRQQLTDNVKKSVQAAVIPFYREASQGQQIMTSFSIAPALPSIIGQSMTNDFEVKGLVSINDPIYRRCARGIDPRHQTFSKLLDPQYAFERREFVDTLIHNAMEIYRGSVMQELYQLIYSPFNIQYDGARQEYTTEPFAFGLTFSNHSTLLFASSSVFDARLGRFRTPLRFYAYDSLSGNLNRFEHVAMLEEYLLNKDSYYYKIRVFNTIDDYRIYNDLVQRTANDRGNEPFIDLSVFSTRASRARMDEQAASLYRRLGLFLDQSQTSGYVPKITKLRDFALSRLGREVAGAAFASSLMTAPELLDSSDAVIATMPPYVMAATTLEFNESDFIAVPAVPDPREQRAAIAQQERAARAEEAERKKKEAEAKRIQHAAEVASRKQEEEVRESERLAQQEAAAREKLETERARKEEAERALRESTVRKERLQKENEERERTLARDKARLADEEKAAKELEKIALEKQKEAKKQETYNAQLEARRQKMLQQQSKIDEQLQEKQEEKAKLTAEHNVERQAVERLAAEKQQLEAELQLTTQNLEDAKSFINVLNDDIARLKSDLTKAGIEEKAANEKRRELEQAERDLAKQQQAQKKAEKERAGLVKKLEAKKGGTSSPSLSLNVPEIIMGELLQPEDIRYEDLNLSDASYQEEFESLPDALDIGVGDEDVIITPRGTRHKRAREGTPQSQPKLTERKQEPEQKRPRVEKRD